MCKSNCDCNCCQPVMAYKSKNGKVYESKVECQRHDKIWQDEQLKAKLRDIFSHVIRKPFIDSYSRLYDTGSIYYETQAEKDLTECVTNWRYLRDKLNAIKD